MKKKHLVIAIYLLYVALLFVLCAFYDLRDEKASSQGFKDLGESLSLVFSFIAISFLTSTVFLIIVYSVYKRFSFIFLIFAPFFTAVALVICGLALDFTLWITQLLEVVNTFQQFFIIATTASMITMIWLLKDMFKDELGKNSAFGKY
jgi:hypothetical protein